MTHTGSDYLGLDTIRGHRIWRYVMLFRDAPKMQLAPRLVSYPPRFLQHAGLWTIFCNYIQFYYISLFVISISILSIKLNINVFDKTSMCQLNKHQQCFNNITLRHIHNITVISDLRWQCFPTLGHIYYRCRSHIYIYIYISVANQ